MPRSPYKPNSLDAGKYDVKPWSIFRIPLIGDRRRGEDFTSIQGEFLYVLAADYPCQITANFRGDQSQAYAAVDGLEISAPFNGITVYHDIIGASATPNRIGQPQLVVISSNDPDAVRNQYSNPVVRRGSPWIQVGPFAGVDGSVSASFPIPSGARAISLMRIHALIDTVAAPANDFRISVDFRIDGPGGSTALDGPSITGPSGTVYNVGASYVAGANFQTRGANQADVGGSVGDLPIPSVANAGTVTIFGGSNNVTAATITGFAVFFR